MYWYHLVLPFFSSCSLISILSFPVFPPLPPPLPSLSPSPLLLPPSPHVRHLEVVYLAGIQMLAGAVGLREESLLVPTIASSTPFRVHPTLNPSNYPSSSLLTPLTIILGKTHLYTIYPLHYPHPLTSTLPTHITLIHSLLHYLPILPLSTHFYTTYPYYPYPLTSTLPTHITLIHSLLHYLPILPLSTHFYTTYPYYPYPLTSTLPTHITLIHSLLHYLPILPLSTHFYTTYPYYPYPLTSTLPTHITLIQGNSAPPNPWHYSPLQQWPNIWFRCRSICEQ